MTNTKTTAKYKPSKGKSLAKNKARSGWVFISPFLIGFLLIYLPMIVDSLKLSFSDNPRTGFALSFVGFDNYKWALTEDPNFVKTLATSIGDLLFNVPAIVVFSLFVAVLLNQKMRGRAIFRAIFFIPVIVSTGIIEYIELQDQLSETMGEVSSSTSSGVGASTGGAQQQNTLVSTMDIERLFNTMKIGTGLVKYVTNIVNSVYDIINKSGVQMLIFLAALQSISPAIYESCQMDGATGWEIFWKITFPMISPMILVNAVYTVIDSFTRQDNVMMSLISSVYSKGEQVHATAMSWIYFLVVILILLIVAAIMGGYVFYQRRDT